MRKNTLFVASVAFVILALLCGLFYAFRSDDSDNRTERTGAKVEGQDQPAAESRRAKGNQRKSEDEAVGAVDKDMLDNFTEEEMAMRPEGWSTGDWIHFMIAYRAGRSANGTVEFYGKIVDENGSPLSGVELVAEITYNEPSLGSVLKTNTSDRKEDLNVKSSADGTFSIIEPVGRSMFLKNFVKDGYKLSGKKSYAYMFSPSSAKTHKADPKNPEVFMLEKAP